MWRLLKKNPAKQCLKNQSAEGATESCLIFFVVPSAL